MQLYNGVMEYGALSFSLLSRFSRDILVLSACSCTVNFKKVFGLLQNFMQLKLGEILRGNFPRSICTHFNYIGGLSRPSSTSFSPFGLRTHECQKESNFFAICRRLSDSIKEAQTRFFDRVLRRSNCEQGYSHVF